jgi:hypothetical protein
MRPFLLSGHAPHSVPTGGCFFGEIAVGFEVDGTSAPDVVEKNAWRYTSTPYYASTVLCLIKLRDILVFTSLTEYFGSLSDSCQP